MNRKPLILYADDNVSLLQGWKALLEAKGYEVLTAIDGTEAVGAFVANPVDLALLDYHMPHMNGDVAAAHMKTRKADVPVALMSADHFPVLANLKAVDAFVCKSEAIPKVLDIVDELLSRRVLFQPLEGWEAGQRAA
jgi:two-component system KDP operon response regulator KdpE